MKKYRVEAFIVPTNVQSPSSPNQIDDEKLAIKFKEKSICEESDVKSTEAGDKVFQVSKDEPITAESCKAEESDVDAGKEEEEVGAGDESSDLSGVFFEIDEHIYDEIKIPEVKGKKPEVENEGPSRNVQYAKAYLKIEEPVYDEPFVGSSMMNYNVFGSGSNSIINNYDVPQSRWTLASSKYRRFGIVAPKLPKRSSSLHSISEGIESLDESLQDELCCHGRKNGCLPSAKRPEDISDEIFKENWMQRLDALRKLETLLKDKEVALQSRERLLFKKEKELRILERLVKDKMKQAELYAKRHRKALSAESVVHDNPNEAQSLPEPINKDHRPKSETGSSNSLQASRTSSRDSLDGRDRDNSKPIPPSIVTRNAPNSRSSLVTDGSRMSHRIGSTRSRSRPRQKIKYEDLDSTLSADLGDSSFVVTSKKFDPVIFKKPLAFTRSASERRPRLELQSVSTLPVKSLSEKSDFSEGSTNGMLEEKALKKLSENIIATQKQESKLFNYGLIDGNVTAPPAGDQEKKDLTNHRKFSYLNLDTINRSIRSRMRSKDRPASWSEETDDWLKKKRQAYNMATKSTTIQSANDKENLDRTKKLNKSSKIAQKKDDNHKRFSIFR